ncbi:MAG: Radical domain protein [Bacillota bacterium]|nr:Radical domain protein [Bacillota bacterium]
MMNYLLENVDVVKGIHFQPVSFFGRHPGGIDNRVTMFDIMKELEVQTQGAFSAKDCYPITTGHPLCCFQSSYQKQKDGTVKSLINYGTKMEGLSCCEAKDPLEIIKKDRDFVLNKWNMQEPARKEPCCSDPGEESKSMDFDQFLNELRRNMFSVSCMAFMDSSNLDAERLKRCRVQVLSPDDRLIPFCAYNSIYRGDQNESI